MELNEEMVKIARENIKDNGMEDVIEDANIIPTGGKIGFPSACITEYKGILTITFVKYHDEEKLIDIVQQHYEEELSKLMKGCNIYEE